MSDPSDSLAASGRDVFIGLGSRLGPYGHSGVTTLSSGQKAGKAVSGTHIQRNWRNVTSLLLPSNHPGFLCSNHPGFYAQATSISWPLAESVLIPQRDTWWEHRSVARLGLGHFEDRLDGFGGQLGFSHWRGARLTGQVGI